jgi:isoleucyl-tRNA synthetase
VKQLADVYRKVRNTARYLLGNLHDFDPRPTNEGGDAVPYDELPLLDQWILQRTAALIDSVTGDFERFEFYRFFQALQNFCVVDLSNVYLDIAKDRLYVSGATEFRRRSCQTVLSLVVERLAGLIAPVLCHMAEDIWQNLPYAVAETSVFERGWPTAPAEWRCVELEEPMERILALRAAVNRQLESCRSNGQLGASLEAQVQLELAEGSEAMAAALQWLETTTQPSVDNLADWLLVSGLNQGGSAPADVLAEANEAGITVRIAKADGEKCERCWHYETDIGHHPSHPTLCGRCVTVLS